MIGVNRSIAPRTRAAAEYVVAVGRISLGRRRRHFLFCRPEGRYVRDLHVAVAVAARDGFRLELKALIYQAFENLIVPWGKQFGRNARQKAMLIKLWV